MCFVADPMVNPLPHIYLNVHLIVKCKMHFFVQRINRSSISCFGMSVFISLLSYIVFKIISIVSSNGTFGNNDATSSDIILYPSGTSCFWMYLMNSVVLIMVNSDLLNGANKVAKYFAVSYLAVPILDTVGLIVKSSCVVSSLC